MQNTLLQMVGRKAPQDGSQTFASKQKNSVLPECTDPFLLMIMNMISGIQENTLTQSQELNGSIANVDSLSHLLQNSKYAPSNFAGLDDSQELQGHFFKMLGLVNSADFKYGADNEVLQKIDLMGSQAAEVNTLNLMADSSEKNDIELGRSFLNQVYDEVKTEQTNKNETSKGADVLSGFNIEKLVATSSDSYTANTLSEERNFAEAVTKAKEKLFSLEPEVDNEGNEVDIDKLQNEVVKSKATTPFELSFKSVSKEAQPLLFNQVSDGIKQNISLGKNEFTIKLKPEALGEITVRLVEKAGKSMLTITTASANTARLINGDINALKEAVAPMNVHVNEAVVQAEGASQGNMQQFSMAGHQFAGHQFTGQESFSRHVYSMFSNSDESIPTDISDDMRRMSGLRVVGDRLDAYI